MGEMKLQLESIGLDRFVTEYRYELCSRTTSPLQMAAFLRFDTNLIEVIREDAVSFHKNLTLYNTIAAQSSPEDFLLALEETNDHIFKLVQEKLQSYNAQDDELARLMTENLEYLCDNTVNRFEFATGLSSTEVITLQDVHRDSQVNQKENLKWLYEVVIDKRAWAGLRNALEMSGNEPVVKYLVEKRILRDEVLPSPLPFVEQLKQKRETNKLKGGAKSGSRGILAVKSCGLIQRDWKSSLTYTSNSGKETCASGVTDFIPPKDTTSVRISRLNFEPSDLTRILRDCKDHLESLTLDDVSFANLDPLPNSKPAQIQILPLPKLKSYFIQLTQNRSHILTNINYHKQTLFFTPSSEQLCHLWHAENTIETIDFIFEKSRLFKMSPKEGQLILRDYKHFDPVKFFEVMNQSAANDKLQNLKSFSGRRLTGLKVCDIPTSVQRLHLRDCDQIESTRNFHNFSLLKNLILSVPSNLNMWDLNLGDLAKLEHLESVVAKKVAVRNTELIKNDDESNEENKNKTDFPSLIYLLFHECLYKELKKDSKIAEIARREPKESIIMEKETNGRWRVRGSSSYQGNKFQEHLEVAFQNSDFQQGEAAKVVKSKEEGSVAIENDNDNDVDVVTLAKLKASKVQTSSTSAFSQTGKITLSLFLLPCFLSIGITVFFAFCTTTLKTQ